MILPRKPEPDPAIRAYVREIESPSVFSESHLTLLRLYTRLGEVRTHALLDDYFAKLREWKAAEADALLAELEQSP